MIEDEKYFMGRDILNQCYSYNQLYHFYRELGLKGIDRYINELQNESKSKSQEIERLNNIINELEKDIERQIIFCTNEANGTTNDKYCRIAIKYLKHLKELLDKENK